MIQQIGRFAAVGAVATLAHTTAAILAAASWSASPQVANLFGFVSALCLSYLGHAFVTFGGRSGHSIQLPRFVVLSVAGLGLSASITAVVCSALGGPFVAAQLAVAAIVPPLTFLGSRFWAFRAAALGLGTRGARSRGRARA